MAASALSGDDDWVRRLRGVLRGMLQRYARTAGAEIEVRIRGGVTAAQFAAVKAHLDASTASGAWAAVDAATTRDVVHADGTRIVTTATGEHQCMKKTVLAREDVPGPRGLTLRAAASIETLFACTGGACRADVSHLEHLERTKHRTSYNRKHQVRYDLTRVAVVARGRPPTEQYEVELECLRPYQCEVDADTVALNMALKVHDLARALLTS